MLSISEAEIHFNSILNLKMQEKSSLRLEYSLQNIQR